MLTQNSEMRRDGVWNWTLPAWVAAIDAAGYYNQDSSDLLCVLAPSNRIGIPANNIPHFNKRLAGRTFGNVEAATRRNR